MHLTPVLVCLPVSGQLWHVSVPLSHTLGATEHWVLCSRRREWSACLHVGPYKLALQPTGELGSVQY